MKCISFFFLSSLLLGLFFLPGVYVEVHVGTSPAQARRAKRGKNESFLRLKPYFVDIDGASWGAKVVTLPSSP